MNLNSANLQLSPEEMRLVSDPGWILTKNSIVGKAVGLLAGLAEAYREVWALGGVAGGGVHAGAAAGAAGAAGAVGSAGAVGGAAAGAAAGTAGGAAGRIAGVEPGDPKVSRGENYRGLPWVMLDFPRVFGRADVFAIRTMFWWGHGFNITLHLKGTFQTLYLPVIRERRVALGAAGFHVGVHPDEWRHEHTAEVFRPFSAAGAVGAAGGAGAVGAVGAVGAAGAAVSGIGGALDEVVAGALAGELGFFKLSTAVSLDRWAEAPELLVGLFGTLVAVLGDAGEGVG